MDNERKFFLNVSFEILELARVCMALGQLVDDELLHVVACLRYITALFIFR